MQNYDNKKSMMRYAFVAIAMTLLAVAVIGKACYIATVQKEYWEEVQSKVKMDSVKIPAKRGNILSSGGQQLSCNLPEYRVYMDYVALKESKRDSMWTKNGVPTKELDTLCHALSRIFPERTAAEYQKYLLDGFEARNNRSYPVINRRIDYNTYQELKKLTLFKARSGLSGFYGTELMIRNRPYGDLALSVVGTTYKENLELANGVKKMQGEPKSGLELTFDTLLRGKPGIIHRRKVLNAWVSLSDTLPTDGSDLVSTIDVGIQDLAERSLINELTKHASTKGVAIVMEVATGNVKAMVSLDRDEDTGTYHESEFNHAISDLPEPGSVFKTASMMVAIEDGYITDTARTVVDTGCGIMEMHGAKMRDHNWHHGGYGVINVPRILQVSSNIGVSWLIDKYYGQQPEKYVDGLYRTGIAEDLKLPFKGYKAPIIRRPMRNEKGKIIGALYPSGRRTSNWAKTTLPWMSIGYETNVPPISVLTFYNAIANNGVMVKPRFITRAEKDGVVTQEFPVEIVKNHICSDKTLHLMQDMLEKVVSVGLAKPAGSKAFKVAGKTGTALIAGNGGYKNGLPSYWLSFCGYFPYEKPTHSCIVCIQYAGPYPSGGKMSGSVFHNIAEGIYAQNIKYDVKAARDSLSIFTPDVKNGNLLAADFVLSHLGLPTVGGWNGSYAEGNPIWGSVAVNGKSIQLNKYTATNTAANDKTMPDVHGMGARDAVFLLESKGAKVTISGRGKVARQSKSAGQTIAKGEKIQLDLI